MRFGLSGVRYRLSPFAELLTLQQVEPRTRVKPLQYQVNFRSNMTEDEASLEVVVLG